MTLETSLIDSALRNWQATIDRTGKLFGKLSPEQLLEEVAQKVFIPVELPLGNRFSVPDKARRRR